MLLFLTLLPWCFASLLPQSDTFALAREMEKDIRLLETKQYFISDNTLLSPSLETVRNDLQLFQVMANTSLANATYTGSSHGRHQVHKWQFDAGEIKAVFRIETTVALDTVLQHRYLDNRPPTQQRVRNSFRFTTYAVSTAAAPAKLFYLSEAEQGLLGYQLNSKAVEIIYSKQKEGLSAVYPAVAEEVKQLVEKLK